MKTLAKPLVKPLLKLLVKARWVGMTKQEMMVRNTVSP